MYAEYFGLRDNPFSIAPDPRFVYMSPHHQEALGHLLYGTSDEGGFVQLTGEVGTGKTTLIRTLLEQQLPEVDVALTLNPRLTVHEFLASVCDELHVSYPRDSETLKPLIDALNEHLLKSHAAGRRTVLIIDEAQNLSRDVLEQIRLLTNLETNRDKLMRIMLVGQPELRDMLAREDLRQLAQRITARYHLGSLTPQQTREYVAHRLQVAGGHMDMFAASALTELHRISRGVPRLINVICDRAMLGAYSQSLRQVDRNTLRKAASEVLEGTMFRASDGGLQKWIWLLAMLLSILGGVALYVWRPFLPEMQQPPAESAVVAPEPPPAPVVPAKEAKPQPGLQIYPMDQQAPMESLLGLWGQPVSGNDPQLDCTSVATMGLRCLSGRSDWDQVRLYDLPAILMVSDDAAGVGQLLLSSIQGSEATVVTPDGERVMSLAELGERWTGEYLLLWKPAIGSTSIGEGSSQSDIRWLHQRLDMHEGRKAPVSLPYTYDAALRRRVRGFQQVNGLDADGLVGERTLILLNQLAPTVGTPVLTRRTGGAG